MKPMRLRFQLRSNGSSWEAYSPIGRYLVFEDGDWMLDWCQNSAGKASTVSGAKRYDTRQLPYDGDPSFPVLPCAWFDQGWFDGSFKSFFKSGTPTPDPRAFAYHWHNQWDAAIEPGSPFEGLEP